MNKTVMLGAVAYDPKVIPIWDIIRDYCNGNGLKLDYVLFSNYEAQVDALLNGMIDIAWNTNVAWVRILHATQGRAKALLMRDTDIDFTTKFIAKKESGFSSVSDLKGKRFALGSKDSAQAAIMPYKCLQLEGVDPEKDLTLVRFNSDLGKHGDTGRSEFDILEALLQGEIDAGAIGSSTWIRMVEEGMFPEGEIESFYTSEGYCHCNFTVMQDTDLSLCERFTSVMLSQDPNDPIIKKMMAMEGLNRWVVTGKDELAGYDLLSQAMSEQNLLENRV